MFEGKDPIFEKKSYFCTYEKHGYIYTEVGNGSWQRKPERAWHVYLQKQLIQAKNAHGMSL